MSKKRQALHDPRRQGTASVTTLAYDYPNRFTIPEHFHDEDQLVYARRGVMTVRARNGLWVVPPRRAVWVPARVPHTIEMTGEVRMTTLYLLPRVAKKLPRACCVLHVSPLLGELIAYACELRALHRAVPREAHVLAALLDQLELARQAPLQLPSPRDPRALRVANLLIANPSDPRPLTEICRTAGASKRTIERTFREETGMTLGKWRQQRSLLHATRLLASGEKVTGAALDAGYDSTSAFITMFRRAMGVTPSRYFDASR
jgi:AraC-like DNA-binding protein/quercetin dioxygenase-like cupin family protein